jgi:hypothetical protein
VALPGVGLRALAGLAKPHDLRPDRDERRVGHALHPAARTARADAPPHDRLRCWDDIQGVTSSSTMITLAAHVLDTVSPQVAALCDLPPPSAPARKVHARSTGGTRQVNQRSAEEGLTLRRAGRAGSSAAGRCILRVARGEARRLLASRGSAMNRRRTTWPCHRRAPRLPRRLCAPCVS